MQCSVGCLSEVHASRRERRAIRIANFARDSANHACFYRKSATLLHRSVMIRVVPWSGYRIIRLTFVGCLACSLIRLGYAAPAPDVSNVTEDEGDGAIPLSREEFAKLPRTASYRAYLPESIDLSKNFPVPGDQGSSRSCTAWAVGYAARGYYSAVAEGRNIRDTANIPSPSYIFGSILSEPHDCRHGSKIVDALDLLKVKGAQSFRSYPFNSKVCPVPTLAQQARALDFRIYNWLSVDYLHIDQLKGELAKRHPVIVSIRDTKAFHKLRGTEIYNVIGSPQVGWHAIVLVGYDERKQAFQVINSWGRGWGDHGFGWFGYAAVASEISEAYVMRPLAPIEEPITTLPLPSPPVVQQPLQAIKPMRVAAFLPGSCSKLSVVRSSPGMSLKIWGFTDSKARLEAAQPKADQTQVQERPWPQCEVLQTLEPTLSNADRPSVAVAPEADRLKGGTLLKFVVKTPSFPSFLHISYLQADGSVINLLQPSSMTLHAYPPNSTVVLGDPPGGGPHFSC